MQLSPEQVKSVNILLNAVQVAQRRGAFSLQDAHVLQEAVDQLVPREEQERQAQEAREAADSQEEDQVSNLPVSDEEEDVNVNLGSD
jgi:hypothetical protein